MDKKRNTPVLIGITGRTGDGRNTVASIIADLRGRDVLSVAITDPVRHAVAAMLGISSEKVAQLEHSDENIPLTDHTMQYLLQTLSDKWGRELVNPNLWTRLAAQRVTAGLMEGRDVTIPDISTKAGGMSRMVRTLHGTMIRVIRPREPWEVEDYSPAGNEVLPDITIVNDGDMKALRRKVMRALDALGIVYG